VQKVLPFGTDAGGGKGPQFKTDAIRGEGHGDWATYFSVMSRTGDFAAVDNLNGDGAIDGFVFAVLLGEA